MRANVSVRVFAVCGAVPRLFFCGYLLLRRGRQAGVWTAQDSFAAQRTHAILTFLKRELCGRGAREGKSRNKTDLRVERPTVPIVPKIALASIAFNH